MLAVNASQPLGDLTSALEFTNEYAALRKIHRDLLQTVSGVTANALSCEVRKPGKYRL